jgi:predicted O-methyltransferase YrrM
MDHFCQNIDGWFNFQDIYDHVVNLGKDGDHFVEVGAWKGQSAAYMAVSIVNSGKNIKFDVVDTWLGSAEHQTDDLVITDSLYNHFLENLKPVEAYYTPVRMTSLEAAALYADESLDFVLLDASHAYEDVKADIQAWLPKIKSGGILAGDDYQHEWQGVMDAVTEMIPEPLIFGWCTWVYQKP